MICEEHFLPEDITDSGVNSDAIPIMPPYLDGPLGGISPWGAESSEEDDEWGTVGAGEDEEEEEEEEEMEEDGSGAPVGPPSPQPIQQVELPIRHCFPTFADRTLETHHSKRTTKERTQKKKGLRRSFEKPCESSPFQIGTPQS